MRLLVLLALSASASVSAIAQPVFGVRASGVYSTASTSGVSLGDAVGVGLGVFAEAPVSPSFSIIADLGYVQGGASDEASRTSTENPDSPDPTNTLIAYRYRTHAVTIAPAAALALRTEDIEPYVFVGPRFDIKLAERLRFDDESGTSDDFPDTAVGVAGGVGVVAGRGRLDLRASSLWGVDSEIRQSALEVRVGLTL